ncbi:MAG: aldo/keto reductase [Armatimonadota bacterium]|nr:aldo/keto reductase [Armatimonadota bacterium]
MFLAGTGAAAVSGVLSGNSRAAAPAAEWRNRQSGMTYRRLGRTGLMVSSMGMGGDDIRPANHDQVLYAIDRGLNYLDTSPRYAQGLSEAGYALVIKARGREKVFLTSKVADEATRDSQAYQKIFASLSASEQSKYGKLALERIEESGALTRDYMGHYFPGQDRLIREAVLHNLLAEKYADRVRRSIGYKEEIIASVEDSLRRLGTDYLDCLLCPHGVDTPYEVTNHPEIFEAFEILKRQGKARFFGLSAHSDPAGVLSAAIDSGQYSMAMVAYNFLNHRPIDPVLEKARKADFGVLAMKASRVLQNPFQRSRLLPDRVRTIHELMPGDDLTPFQKGFKWALANDRLSGVVAGISNLEMAQQDLPLAMTAA